MGIELVVSDSALSFPIVRPTVRKASDGFDVKDTDSAETMFDGWKMFLRNRAFPELTEDELQDVPQRERLYAMAEQAEMLIETPEVWRVFASVGCGFGFTPTPEKERTIKSLLFILAHELRDPNALRFNSKF
jgi:hypothetical protein